MTTSMQEMPGPRGPAHGKDIHSYTSRASHQGPAHSGGLTLQSLHTWEFLYSLSHSGDLAANVSAPIWTSPGAASALRAGGEGGGGEQIPRSHSVTEWERS